MENNLRKELLPNSTLFNNGTLSTVTDFEGIVRNTRANEARFDGARRAENLVLNSSGVPASSHGGGTNALNVLTFVNSNSYFRMFSIALGNQPEIYRLTLTLAGSANLSDLELEGVDGSDGSDSQLIRANITTTPQRFSFIYDLSTTTTFSGNFGFFINRIASVPAGYILTATDVHFEKITNQTNKNPSEFVDDSVKVKYFDAENGNLVNANGLVTINNGAAIQSSTLIGLSINPATQDVFEIQTTQTTDFYASFTITPDVDLSTLASSDVKFLSSFDSRGWRYHLRTDGGGSYGYTHLDGGGIFRIRSADFIAGTSYDMVFSLAQEGANVRAIITRDGAEVLNTTTAGTLSHTNSGLLKLGSYNTNFISANFKDYHGVNPDTVSPLITLIGNSVVNINVGDTYNDAGATAFDDISGDITANIVVSNPVDVNAAGTYTITYNVNDGAGNAADEVVRTVNVLADIVSPVITLLGPSFVSINVGGTYAEQGATAFDDISGDITADIIVAGIVDAATAGTYTITYNVNDNAGNSADEIVRLVYVLAPGTGGDDDLVITRYLDQDGLRQKRLMG